MGFFMSLYIDLKYVNMMSHRLERFARKDDYLFNFRCPICGDSSAKKTKTRGYIYRKENDMFYRCHNCSYGTTLGKFVEHIDPILYKEYVLEKFVKPKDPAPVKTAKRDPKNQFDFVSKFDKPLSIIDGLMDRLDTLPMDHEVIKYVQTRQLPVDKYSRLYYIDDIRNLSQLNPKYTESLNIEQPRLVLPFVDTNGHLTGMAMRGIRGEKLRYINLKIDEDSPTIYGIDAIDKDKEVYIVEGPIDSLFLDNAIACVGTAFNKIDRLGLTYYTVIFDNQPRNKEVCSLIRKQIDMGNRVCIWPDDMQKDINDMILSGLTKEDIQYIIDSNTFDGLEAELRFSQWRKC